MSRLFHIVFLALFIFSKSSFALSLEDIYADIKLHYPQYKGITYDEPSYNNSFVESEWLIQTPNMWDGNLAVYNDSFTPRNGQPLDPEFHLPTCFTQDDCGGMATCKVVNFTSNPKKLCVTKAYDFLEKSYDAIISAHDSVDIATLALPASNKKAFRQMFKNAILTLASKSILFEKKIVIRYLQGSFSPVGLENAKDFLNDLVKNLPKENKLIFSISDMRSCDILSKCEKAKDDDLIISSFSWNHGKIINIDNNSLIVGGENFSGTDYLELNPVNDFNMKIEGAVSEGATIYTDILWNYVNRNKGLFANICKTYENGKITNNCIVNIHNELVEDDRKEHEKTSTVNSVKAMFVSKLNYGVGLGQDADQSELARVYAIKQATNSVKISQQALYFTSGVPFSHDNYLHPSQTVDGNLIQALAYAMYENGVNVYIVTGNLADDGLMGYSSFVNLDYIYDCLLSTLQAEFHITSKEGMKELNEHLYLGYLGYFPMIFSDDPKIMQWHRSHNKFWMVDDKIFYFGSHNFYPSSLQEFGVIVESPESARYLLQNFWDPMWSDAVKP